MAYLFSFPIPVHYGASVSYNCNYIYYIIYYQATFVNEGPEIYTKNSEKFHKAQKYCRCVCVSHAGLRPRQHFFLTSRHIFFVILSHYHIVMTYCHTVISSCHITKLSLSYYHVISAILSVGHSFSSWTSGISSSSMTPRISSSSLT